MGNNILYWWNHNCIETMKRLNVIVWVLAVYGVYYFLGKNKNEMIAGLITLVTPFIDMWIRNKIEKYKKTKELFWATHVSLNKILKYFDRQEHLDMECIIETGSIPEKFAIYEFSNIHINPNIVKLLQNFSYSYKQIRDYKVKTLYNIDPICIDFKKSFEEFSESIAMHLRLQKVHFNLKPFFFFN